MGQETINRNKDSNFYGPYAGRDLYITMYQESEREFVVTHKTNIRPVSYFTGRETELKELRQRIEEGRKSVLVSGMGGIGKTHICRKLFEEYQTKNSKGENRSFSHIGYIEYNGDMNSSLQECLRYKKQENPELNKETAWKELEYLASDGKLLLFVDNVNVTVKDDPSLERLKKLPGAIVLTSRRTAFSNEFEQLRIGFLDKEQCREIYEKIRFEDSGIRVKEEEVPDLEYIIEELAAKHTITVEHLAHLARANGWTVKTLRDQLEKKGFQLEYVDDEEKLVNIQESYEILYDLSELTEAEQNILEAFSVFPYIPLEKEICNQWLLADAGVSEKEKILSRLYRKGWLQFDIEQESYALHPVFAQFIYEKCKPRLEKHQGLIEKCQKSLEIPESGYILECQKYIPFAENILEKVDMGKNEKQSHLMICLGYLLYQIAEYEKAKDLYKKTIIFCEKILGEEHLHTIIVYKSLAQVYQIQGKYEKAKGLFEKSLRICKKVLGDEHLETAKIYHELAVVYVEQGKYEKAKKLYIKSLKIYRKVLGDVHPHIADCYNNLATMYTTQAEYEKAKELFEKSLQICEKVLGNNHPNTAKSYHSLAGLYLQLGEYEKAKGLFEKSLEICKNVFGEEHPNTAHTYHNMALVYKSQGKYEKAKGLFEKSLEICKKVLEEEHPDIAILYHNLAGVYIKQGEYEKAKELFEKGLWIHKKVFGNEHLNTIASYNNLAGMYDEQGEYEKARELYEKNLSICERVLGDEHHLTTTIYHNLGGLYATQGEYEKALFYCTKAYKINILKLGLDHPDTKITYKKLRMIYEGYNTKGNFNQWLEEKMKE